MESKAAGQYLQRVLNCRGVKPVVLEVDNVAKGVFN